MKTTLIQPKISIVGAGPGDAELLTIKAVKALNSADVVLYDALVNTEILKHVPFNVPRIFVGKRKSKHTYSQDEINQLLVSFAYTHGHVVRLKGGDPFVFGRGAEEIAFAESFNITTQYIPGISSAVAVAGLAGIPVTHRGLAESFWVITGTTKSGQLSADVFDAAKTNATIVVLMGINKIAEIVSVFISEGKQNLPVAIIQNGSTFKENHVIGTINTIEVKAKEELTEGPGIIIIGEVVKLHPYFEHETRKAVKSLSAAASSFKQSSFIKPVQQTATKDTSSAKVVKDLSYFLHFKYLLN